MPASFFESPAWSCVRRAGTARDLFSRSLAARSIGDPGAERLRPPLTGDQEVPPVATDTTGKAFLCLVKAATELEFELRVNEGVRITQAHLHCAPAGVNGPIVVFLAGLHAAGLDVDGKWISNATITDTSIVNTACGSTVSALAASMRLGNVYANVHSFAHPTGVMPMGDHPPSNVYILDCQAKASVPSKRRQSF